MSLEEDKEKYALSRTPDESRQAVIDYFNSCKKEPWNLDSSEYAITFDNSARTIWVEFHPMRTVMEYYSCGVAISKAKFMHIDEGLILGTLAVWMDSPVFDLFNAPEPKEIGEYRAARGVIGALAASIRGNWNNYVKERLDLMQRLVEKYFPRKKAWRDWFNDDDNIDSAIEDGRHMRDSWPGPYEESCPQSYFDRIKVGPEELGDCWESHVEK